MTIVLIRDYATEQKPYCNGFVHARVKAYIESGIETKVFVLNPNRDVHTYVYDNVEVIVGGKEQFLLLVNEFENVTVCVHFLDSYIIDCLNNTDRIKKVIVFVHGYEALHWYQRIFAGTFANFALCKSFLGYIYNNVRELKIIRKFLNVCDSKYEFVTVSEWMRLQAEKAWECEGKFKWHIIPNYIDSKQFAYEEKDESIMYNMLSIRPFSSGKYANDVTAKFIKKISQRIEKNTFKITWIGDGLLFNKNTKSVIGIDNLMLEKRMLQHSEIYDYHKMNGIFICPTRQDAQGVSMCEAMSSGLIPVTLYNTAIPEYLPNIKDLKCNNVDDMVNLTMKLLNDTDLYKFISSTCSEFICEKCGYDNTIRREIALIENI